MPPQMTPEYLDWVIKTYKIDFVVHGDDPCLGPDGKDVYGHVKERGMWVAWAPLARGRRGTMPPRGDKGPMSGNPTFLPRVVPSVFR